MCVLNATQIAPTCLSRLRISTRLVGRWRHRSYVGIDLGTTNSSIAIVSEKGPSVVEDVLGRSSIPSEICHEEVSSGSTLYSFHTGKLDINHYVC